MEIWGLNYNYKNIPNVGWDRYFQLHRRAWLHDHEPHWFTGHQEWLPTLRHCKFYVWEPYLWPEVHEKALRAYPKAQVEALTQHGAYHLGSFDWMVALAILEQFETIRMYGVTFDRGGEPIGARGCLEYWLGVAEARGIGVEVFGGDLFTTQQVLRSTRQYGYEDVELVVSETEVANTERVG